MELEKFIDQTLLKNTISAKEIEQFCLDNNKQGFASLCLPPFFVKKAADILNRSETKVCTVIGFPLGYNTTESKVFETQNALDNGADEIDMVININELKNKNFNFIEKEIQQLAKLCKKQDPILKVIIESCLLEKSEIIELCHIVYNCGADYIKTSTGFSTHGATIDTIQLMKKHAHPNLKIKASGGIKNKETAIQMIEAGADRLGTSSGQIIIQ